MHDHLRRLFEYEEWANRTEVDHLRALGAPPERAVSLLAHIVGAQRLWHARLRRESSPMLVWPALTLDDCAHHLHELHKAWHFVLDSTDVEKTIDYMNSRGERWTNTIGDILTHIILHGAYHRGQIALVLRDGANAPAYTDYIECVRRGFI